MSNNDPPKTRRGNPGARSYMKTIFFSLFLKTADKSEK
jgi:hypothetical protein